ncbi:hypothetical protein AB0K48_52815, partial [Nonomuraea sp. NPDC055795]
MRDRRLLTRSGPASSILRNESIGGDHVNAQRDYDTLVSRGLKLDLTRGKPSPRQLDLADAMLTLPTSHVARDGMDGRNYGN